MGRRRRRRGVRVSDEPGASRRPRDGGGGREATSSTLPCLLNRSPAKRVKKLIEYSRLRLFAFSEHSAFPPLSTRAAPFVICFPTCSHQTFFCESNPRLPSYTGQTSRSLFHYHRTCGSCFFGLIRFVAPTLVPTNIHRFVSGRLFSDT
jgi:hypothetical protein